MVNVLLIESNIISKKMHKLEKKIIQICVQYTHSVQTITSSHRHFSYVPIHVSVNLFPCSPKLYISPQERVEICIRSSFEIVL